MAEVDNPSGPQDWTFADRDQFTARWNRANVVNLMRGASGSGEYRSIAQRTDFYDWFDQIREVQRHEILWPAAAWLVASQMRNLEDPTRTAVLTARRVITLNMETSTRLITFGREGNAAIFDDVFPRLGAVHREGLMGRPIRDVAAGMWDQETLRHEQYEVVQPIYERHTAGQPALVRELQALASGSDVLLFGSIAIWFTVDFAGNIMSPLDRFHHGLSRVVGTYMQFKQAIDSGRRRRQASPADPTAGGMVRAG